MAKRKFKAESQRLLDMMINSIYTHREIFLRELISNANDAIDKMYYRALSENMTGLNREDFNIRITVDKQNRLITVSDNGCGMTDEEMDKNLGVIANSGSLAFKKEMDKTDDIDVIGQFGVGFYSAFMVAEQVTVLSRSFQSEKAYRWVSSGVDGYTIEEGEKQDRGTDVILKLKPNTEEENYDEFLESYRLRELVKKYSDYIRYPILMEVEKHRKKEDSDEYESYFETETVNSMVPIWKKNRSEVTKEEYESFYQQKFFDYEKPLRVIHSSTEGASTYNALLFIPGRAPYDYYTRDFEKGLQLYSSGVLIMEKCADLLPDHFSFVKGLVDSQDLSLNISREMLQHDRQLKLIAGRLEKKIKSELLSMLQNDRENYETFFNHFGLQLKYGVYSSYGMNNELLKDLLLFYSSSEKKLVSFEEYLGRMKEDQKYIYYASGDTVEHIDRMPQTELLKEKGYEILYLTDSIDEFALQMLGKVGEKEFKSIADKDLGIETEQEKESVNEENAKHSELFRFMKDALGDKVAEVRLSSRLKSHPVCISSEGSITLEMEKVINALPANEQKIQAKRVLEINKDHPVFQKLTQLFGTDTEKLKTYTSLLYDQAMLMEGMAIEDPVAFANAICGIMAE